MTSETVIPMYSRGLESIDPRRRPSSIKAAAAAPNLPRRPSARRAAALRRRVAPRRATAAAAAAAAPAEAAPHPLFIQSGEPEKVFIARLLLMTGSFVILCLLLF